MNEINFKVFKNMYYFFDRYDKRIFSKIIKKGIEKNKIEKNPGFLIVDNELSIKNLEAHPEVLRFINKSFKKKRKKIIKFHNDSIIALGLDIKSHLDSIKKLKSIGGFEHE